MDADWLVWEHFEVDDQSVNDVFEWKISWRREKIGEALLKLLWDGFEPLWNDAYRMEVRMTSRSGRNSNTISFRSRKIPTVELLNARGQEPRDAH